MFGAFNVIALVPARGGSKGIPRKNLSMVGNKTLVERAVMSGLLSRFVDEVIVSTDDPDIARTAAQFGARIHYRSSNASTDIASASDVLEDFLETGMENTSIDSTLIVYLQPTSPLRNHSHVDEALETMERRGSDRCASVVRSEHSPYKALLVGPDGYIEPLFDEKSVTTNRQMLPITFRANGAIYVFPLSAFAEMRQFPVAGSVGYEMSPDESIDVDSPRDLQVAEFLLETRTGR